MRLWKNSLRQGVSFSPEHISCYQLTLEAKTPLYKKYLSEKLMPPAEKTELIFFLTTADFLEDAGYIHYEVSNFARTDSRRSRHNSKYWQHVPYLGLGPAAHSFLPPKRWWNKPSVRNYLQAIEQGIMPVENSEELSLEQMQLETLFLGLRTATGIDLRLYQSKFGIDLLVDKKTMLDKLLENKLINLEDGFIIPTRTGMAMADSLALI
jgi:oxygen-independent coproporphyrinogen-3 oxidase